MSYNCFVFAGIGPDYQKYAEQILTLSMELLNLLPLYIQEPRGVFSLSFERTFHLLAIIILLVNMMKTRTAIITINPKPTKYSNLYENTGPDRQTLWF